MRAVQPIWRDEAVAKERAALLSMWYQRPLTETIADVVADERFCLNAGAAQVTATFTKAVTHRQSILVNQDEWDATHQRQSNRYSTEIG